MQFQLLLCKNILVSGGGSNRGTAHQHGKVLVGHTRSQIFTRSQ
ncbi:hypothetical protein ACN38_g6242, partial [Penicillium nordicum]